MRMFICSVCGYIYDEAVGIPAQGIAPGTKWEDLPAGWVCPLCGASKAEFKEKGGAVQEHRPRPTAVIPVREGERTPMEKAALCSNLARGCEKQYRAEEAALFGELAEYFTSAAEPAADPTVEELLRAIGEDLDTYFPQASEAAGSEGDRGALRALVWSEKVTRIIKTLLTRYQAEGEAMLEGKDVYICPICGFIFVGNELPEVCPVCKVPSWKFEKVEGRVAG